MGFLDKAKKLAGQAQSKLDEVQKQHSGSSAPPPSDQPVVHYDKHGRPIVAAPDAAPAPSAPPVSEVEAVPHHAEPPPPGTWSSAAPPPPPPPPGGDTAWAPLPATPGLPPTEPSAPVEGSASPSAPPGVPDVSPEDPDRPDHEPPKLTGGDPLAG